MSKEEMAQVTEEAVRRSGITEAYIRHVVSRGVGDLGLDPRKCPRPSVIIIVDTIKLWPEEVYETGLKVVTAGTPIPQRESLSPRVKSPNYLPHILAKIEGVQAGADEVLMLDSQGHVAEGSGQNIFVVKHKRITTPPVYAGILKGVTRDVVIELARGAGYDVQREHAQSLRRLYRGRGLLHRDRLRGRGHPSGGRAADRGREVRPGHARSPRSLPGAGAELTTARPSAAFSPHSIVSAAGGSLEGSAARAS